MILTFRPIKVWPEGWQGRRSRSDSPFSSGYRETLELLDRELRQIGATDVTMQVDVSERDCKLDGQLRADARPNHPGVILSVGTRKHGTLVYATDRFNHWHANLRAIALGMEALRRVERYGIAEQGQQYAGYRELGAGIALSAHTMTVEECARLLCDATQDTIGEHPDDVVRSPGTAQALWREAAKTHHPDAGGDPEKFRRLTEARDRLVAHR